MELNMKDVQYITELNANHSKRKQAKQRRIPFVEIVNNKIVYRSQQEEILRKTVK